MLRIRSGAPACTCAEHEPNLPAAYVVDRKHVKLQRLERQLQTQNTQTTFLGVCCLALRGKCTLLRGIACASEPCPFYGLTV